MSETLQEARVVDRLRRRALRRGLSVAVCKRGSGGWLLVDRQSRFVVVGHPDYGGIALDELGAAIDDYPVLSDPAWVPPAY